MKGKGSCEGLRERVYIDGEAAMTMTLRSNYHLVLGHNVNGPTEFTVDPFVYTCGSDGIRALARISSVIFLPGHVAKKYLANR